MNPLEVQVSTTTLSPKESPRTKECLVESLGFHNGQQGDALTLRELHPGDRSTWDALIQSSPLGCFMQAWAWADFKELEGYQTFRYGLFTGNTLVGGSIFYFYPHHSPANLLTASGGPLLVPGQEAVSLELLLNQVQLLAKQKGAIALQIEPLLAQKPAYLKGFVRAPADLLPSESLWIDLRPSVAEILASMKPKGRYNVRLSQRHGIQTSFTTASSAIPVFYDCFWQTVERQKFFGEPYGFFINLCQTLFAAGMAEIGLATRQDKVLAAIVVVYWGDRATYLYGGRSLEHSQGMPTYGLHWAAMQRAKARGCSFYDFYGYTQNPQHSYARFSQFKRQFGGIPVTTIGAQNYFFYDRLADTLIAILKKLNN